MTRLERLCGLRVRAMFHVLTAEPYSEARFVRDKRAWAINRAYWDELHAYHEARDQRANAYLESREGGQ